MTPLYQIRFTDEQEDFVSEKYFLSRALVWCKFLNCYMRKMGIQKPILGQVWWLMLIIPALWEAEAGRSPEIRSSRPNWPTWQNTISTKNTKIRRVWWHMPVLQATWEAETGELLELGRWRLCWAKIATLPSSLGSRVRLHLKEEKKTN